MSKSKELVKNTIIILFGKLCTQLITFLMLPLYTKVLASEEYGKYDLISTYISLATPIVGFQLEMGLFRFLIDSRKDEKKKVSLITNCLFVLLASLTFFILAYFTINRFVSIPYFYPVLVCAVFTLLSGVLLQIARGFGDNIGYSIASIIAGVSSVLLNILFLVVLEFGIEGILYATAIGNALACVFLIIKEKMYKYISAKTYDREIVFKLLKYSSPLIPNSLIWWVIGVSDRTIISIFLNASANGIYAVSNKFSTIMSSIYGIFNLSWTESASLHINDEDRDRFFSDTFNATIRFFACLCLAILAVMPIAFKLMVGDDYGEAYLYIPVLIMGMLFNIVVSFIGAIYIAKKKTKQVATTSLWSGISNIAINVALIKYVGLWAASFSTLLAFLIMSVYRYFDVQKYVKLKLDIKNTLVLIVLSVICIVLYYFHNYYVMAVNIAVVGCVGITFNRRMIIDILRGFKAKFLN